MFRFFVPHPPSPLSLSLSLSQYELTARETMEEGKNLYLFIHILRKKIQCQKYIYFLGLNLNNFVVY